ncbi:ATP synthase subunit I [uncultured Lamprocystis sp.]|jgi:ATP synthase protein I|uniref:ATP synthase subunit I n=1 Tax=uncultured Lamprocystis sp. TaxID=543132 RepID=UPI0025D0BC9F|nr:ATP synthase subunit I [uncultured Lamprocystis sp.]
MQQADALLAKKTLQVQVILGLSALLIAIPFGWEMVISVMIGVGSCLFANFLFAVLVFRGYRAQEPGRLLLNIYGAEVAKLVVLIGLFGVAFATLDGLNVPALLVAYLVIQVASTLIAAQLSTRAAPGRAPKTRTER